MNPLVTVGIPVYKRLDYLPQALKSVDSQDYPAIELIVSDNGLNGPKIQEIVKAYYSRPYKFRQNPSIVPISIHFNQIVQKASGEYFVLLCDDDEISPNYISELVGLLERNPEASVAISGQEIMDRSGVTIRRSKAPLPDILPGAEFIEAVWHRGEYGFECFATTLARTDQVKMCGGYPDFTRGNHNDNALLIKLCLNSYVVFSHKCTFRWRTDESSHGWSVSIGDLAEASTQFLDFLDSDSKILAFASTNPDRWARLREYVVNMVWNTYFVRWQTIYKERISRGRWIRAAFALPFIPAYYFRVIHFLIRAILRKGEVKIARRWLFSLSVFDKGKRDLRN